MSKLDDAKRILAALGLPPAQQNDIAAYTLLGFANVEPSTGWKSAQPVRTGPHGVLKFTRDAYGRDYAENTREDVRRKAIHQFVQAGVLVRNPDDPALPTNSPRTHYALTAEALETLRAFGLAKFEALATAFREASEGGLALKYSRDRERQKVPITLPNGKEFLLSPGDHNRLQRAIIDDFLSTFAPGAVLLYLGDTEVKSLFVAERELSEIGVTSDAHGKLADIVAYDAKRNWLFLCEAVTSHGPVSPKRHLELEQLLTDCTAQRVYVTAFLTFREYKRHAQDIAWETEVWIADAPAHLLHYDGEKFISTL